MEKRKIQDIKDRKLTFRIKTEEQHKQLKEAGLDLCKWNGNSIYVNNGTYFSSVNEDEIMRSWKEYILIEIDWEESLIYEIY